MTFTVVHDARAARLLAANGHGLGLPLDALRHLLLAGQGGAQPSARLFFEQDGAPPDHGGQMLADGGIDVADRMRGRQLSREGVEVLDLGLAPARELGLSPQVGREVARDDRDKI